MTDHPDIFEYIESQENSYKQPISINDVWKWGMKQHILRSELYANSQLMTGKSERTPVKNITRPILNLQHRTEDIEVKDVQIYVDDPSRFHLSFLVKKYHDDVFVIENDMDTFFDDLNISRIDYGAGLSKQLNKPCPEVVPLQSIAFCDQSDILSGPIGIKHYYSPDQLMSMKKVGWGNKDNGATITVESLITLSRDEKKDDNTNDQSKKTPGRYIEVYEVHGNLPKKFFNPEDTSGEYETRLCICAFYQKKEADGRSGVILYTAPEKESPFKIIKRDSVYGRALGFGGAEELFDAQQWTNYDEIRMQDMLDSASKTILKATGANSKTIAQENDLKNMDNLSIVSVGTGDLAQVDTFPRNIRIFEESANRWQEHAQQMSAANDAIMGESPASGTPFKLQELVVSANQGLHDYRRGQYAKHLEEIYTDWIIPHIQKKITEGAKFLSELSLEDLQYVTEAIVTNETNKKIKEMVIAGAIPSQEEIDVYKDIVREQFKKKGNKHFIEILKGEFKDVPLAVKVSISGKSKNLAQMTEKIVNIFRFAFSNPQGFAQTMQIPGMARSFNQILEFSGLSPVDFSGIEKLAMQPVDSAPAPQEPEPVPA